MAIILKIPVDKKQGKKPLSPLQKKLLKAPTMTEKQYKEYLKTKKWMGKWKA